MGKPGGLPILEIMPRPRGFHVRGVVGFLVQKFSKIPVRAGLSDTRSHNISIAQPQLVVKWFFNFFKRNLEK